MKKLRFPFVAIALCLFAFFYLLNSPAPMVSPKIISVTQEISAAPVKPALLEVKSKPWPLARLEKGERGVTVIPPAPRSPAKFEPLSLREIEAARTEMKISLAAIYAAQKSFFAETGRYSSDIYRAIGYSPEGSERWSNVGFLQAYQPEKFYGNEEPRNLSLDLIKDPELKISFARSGQNISLQDLGRFCAQGCTADAEKFEVIAAAQFLEGAEPDVWVINDKKEIIHMHDGTSHSPASR